MQAIDSGGKGKGKGAAKGKGKGRGGSGRGRAAAGHGSGAVAACVEADHAYALDGTLLAVYNTPAPEADVHDDDEEAHTAAFDASSSSSDFDDGDGWMNDIENSTHVSSINFAAIESSSESGECYSVNSDNCSSADSDESEESTNVCLAQFNPAEESSDSGDEDDFGISLIYAPATENVADLYTAPAALDSAHTHGTAAAMGSADASSAPTEMETDRLEFSHVYD